MIQIIRVKEIIKTVLAYIPYEYKSGKAEEDTFLYRLLNGVKDDNFDFYKQAKTLFTRSDSSPRKIAVTLEFPKDKTSLPCYVIREPGKIKGPVNSIGKLTGDIYPDGAWEVRDSREQGFEIMCLSDNVLESILMSEVLYGLLLGSYNLLAMNFSTIEINMTELMANTELIPLPIFIKSIRLDVSSEQIVSSLINSDFLSKIEFEDAGEAAITGENYGRMGLPGVESEIV
jgi:hypothetical protein